MTFPSQRGAFLTSAVAVGAVFFLCSLVLFLGVKEQKGEVPPGGCFGLGGWVKMPSPASAELGAEAGARPSYPTALRMLLGHVPYQRLVLGFTFCVLAFQVTKTPFFPSGNGLK